MCIELDGEDDYGGDCFDILDDDDVETKTHAPPTAYSKLSSNQNQRALQPAKKANRQPGFRGADGTTTKSYVSSSLCNASAGAVVRFPARAANAAPTSSSSSAGLQFRVRNDVSWDNSQWRDEVTGYAVLDAATRDTWEWPSHESFADRQYQLEISSVAHFQNTLVSLPTGLGKTFIAAVVMHNYYRWFPGGAVVFLAPSRPLATQQVEACARIVGLPAQATALMLGKTTGATRASEWKTRRVFYCTPQTFVNDITAGRVDAKRIVLVVLDEAHRATGAYAYVKCIQALDAAKARYRVLALSATPGTDVNKVRDVIQSLHISRIEARTHDDESVSPYVNETLIDKIVVPLSPALLSLSDEFCKVIANIVGYLVKQGAMASRTPPKKLSLKAILIMKETLAAARRGDDAGGGRGGGGSSGRGRGRGRGGSKGAASAAAAAATTKGVATSTAAARVATTVRDMSDDTYHNVSGTLTLLLQLIPCLKELTFHGSAAAHASCERLEAAAQRSSSWALTQLVLSRAWKDIIARLRSMAATEVTPGDVSSISGSSSSNSSRGCDAGHVIHPKLVKLGEVLTEHFARKAESGVSSRAIVFTGTRTSVDEIIRYLEKNYGRDRPPRQSDSNTRITDFYSRSSSSSSSSSSSRDGDDAPDAQTELRAVAFVGQARSGGSGAASASSSSKKKESIVQKLKAVATSSAASSAAAAAAAATTVTILDSDDDDEEEDDEAAATMAAAGASLTVAGGAAADVSEDADDRAIDEDESVIAAVKAALVNEGEADAAQLFMQRVSDSVAMRGQTQKEQVATIDSFRRGVYNVLVATCIGEEVRAWPVYVHFAEVYPEGGLVCSFHAPYSLDRTRECFVYLLCSRRHGYFMVCSSLTHSFARIMSVIAYRALISVKWASS